MTDYLDERADELWMALLHIRLSEPGYKALIRDVLQRVQAETREADAKRLRAQHVHAYARPGGDCVICGQSR